MPSDEPLDTVPIEMFEDRNRATCKFCGRTIYWVWLPRSQKHMPYEIQTRTPHADCFDKSNLRKWKYK